MTLAIGGADGGVFDLAHVGVVSEPQADGIFGGGGSGDVWDNLTLRIREEDGREPEVVGPDNPWEAEDDGRGGILGFGNIGREPVSREGRDEADVGKVGVYPVNGGCRDGHGVYVELRKGQQL